MAKRSKTKTLAEFNKFLGQIDLGKYREKYSHIKLVELDMPRNIQAISLLYEYYWDKCELLDCGSFYKVYSKSLSKPLEEFRKKQMFSEETFYRGLPARIYRTWASLLTQIQGGHLANTMYHKVEMSAQLDYSGIDIRIFPESKSDEYINIQVKKESLSREVRAPWPQIKNQEQIINITYEVTYAQPLTKTGKISVPYNRWSKRYKDKLQILDNGFVIFLPGMFAKDNISV